MILIFAYHDRYDEMSIHCHVNPWPQVLVQVVALKNPIKKIISYYYINHKMLYIFIKKLLTRGGKIFSAALRGTENPPWVLVSLAVKVLQKNSVCGLCAFIKRSDLNNASLSNCK